tara:strand:+ start:173 stop:454 length:282 start_codon:yes stop_codon:yes gene_type:complete
MPKDKDYLPVKVVDRSTGKEDRGATGTMEALNLRSSHLKKRYKGRSAEKAEASNKSFQAKHPLSGDFGKAIERVGRAHIKEKKIKERRGKGRK